MQVEEVNWDLRRKMFSFLFILCEYWKHIKCLKLSRTFKLMRILGKLESFLARIQFVAPQYFLCHNPNPLQPNPTQLNSTQNLFITHDAARISHYDSILMTCRECRKEPYSYMLISYTWKVFGKLKWNTSDCTQLVSVNKWW